MDAVKGEVSIVIHAPAERVYNYLLDFARHPEWAKNLNRVVQTSPGAIGLGTTFKTEEGPPPVSPGVKLKMMVYFVTGLLGGARPYSEAKITALEPGRRIAWQAGIPKGNSYFSFAEWEFVLAARGEDTFLVQHFCYAPPDAGGQQMVGAAGLDGIERACAVNLAHLKRRLEGAP